MSDFIQFSTISVELPDFDQDLVSYWIETLVKKHRMEIGELHYYFCNDEAILEANQKHLKHDYYTDIITFDLSVGNLLMADLLISVDTVASNAVLFKVKFKEELLRVIIHGVLHMIGFDDKTEEAQEEMTKQENKALKLFEEIKAEQKSM